MGIFSGMLLVSDFDNTLVYTEEALRLCVDMPPMSPGNRAAHHFMDEGGIFAVATGRAKPAFETVVDDIPMNGPTVLFNGAAIYDFSRHEYLYTAFLPEGVRAHIAQVVRDLPATAVELYHDDNSIHALNPNDVTRRHMHITHAPSVEVSSMDEVPSPISKALFSVEEQNLPVLLELTTPFIKVGGTMLGISRENVVCVGDHANDISMLTWAGLGCAPANAIPLVRETPGVHLLPDCREDAIAALIGELEKARG